MEIFEYKTASIQQENIEESLNTFGKNGWELVSMISAPQVGNTAYALIGFSVHTTAVFKRKKMHEPETGVA